MQCSSLHELTATFRYGLNAVSMDVVFLCKKFVGVCVRVCLCMSIVSLFILFPFSSKLTCYSLKCFHHHLFASSSPALALATKPVNIW